MDDAIRRIVLETLVDEKAIQTAEEVRVVVLDASNADKFSKHYLFKVRARRVHFLGPSFATKLVDSLPYIQDQRPMLPQQLPLWRLHAAAVQPRAGTGRLSRARPRRV